jgi:hypothetical protein
VETRPCRSLDFGSGRVPPIMQTLQLKMPSRDSDACPHSLGRYYDPECLGANSVMKRRIHDADFAVTGHVDSWGPGLHPYLVHFERI